MWAMVEFGGNVVVNPLWIARPHTHSVWPPPAGEARSPADQFEPPFGLPKAASTSAGVAGGGARCDAE